MNAEQIVKNISLDFRRFLQNGYRIKKLENVSEMIFFFFSIIFIFILLFINFH